MREKTLLHHAGNLISGFDFSTPFHHFIQHYFRQNKQLGSRDRKMIASLCYSYFRCGKMFTTQTIVEKIVLSYFLLCHEKRMLAFICENYLKNVPENLDSFEEKFQFLKTAIPDLTVANLFPWEKLLSVDIHYNQLAKSFLKQPLTWIRIKKATRAHVLNELQSKTIVPSVEHLPQNALGFEPLTPLTILNAYQKGWFEIQDLSSQKTLNFFPTEMNGRWWDCCSGSGGKTLMAADHFPFLQFHLSDTRTAVLENAGLRLTKAGVKKYSLEISDVSQTKNTGMYDGIITDVPCTGSGTWARTPENLWNFSREKLTEYATLQRNIIGNVLQSLKPSGYLIYITCSVFKEENENNVDFFCSHFPLNVIKKECIAGYNERADTLFACLLQKAE